MSHSTSYLTFNLHDLLYGIDAFLVREIFYLPEIMPVAELPPDVVGVINLRGEILPIVNLQYRFGQTRHHYHLSDSVIVLEANQTRLGIIVNSVREVLQIEAEAIAPPVVPAPANAPANHFIRGMARVDTTIIAILNHDQLLQYTNSIERWATSNGHGHGETTASLGIGSEPAQSQLVFFPDATPQERTILRERADNLRRAPERQDYTGLIPLAVIGLNQEYFGLDLDAVREFTDIRQITPIPCCPNHIVGNMNLRGEIVTLIDIRKALNLPAQEYSNNSSNTSSKQSKAMVIHLDDLIAGVLVDDVFDVMYLNPADINAIPTATNTGSDDYLKGTTSYRDKMMSVLDLSKIVNHGGLIVNEEV